MSRNGGGEKRWNRSKLGKKKDLAKRNGKGHSKRWEALEALKQDPEQKAAEGNVEPKGQREGTGREKQTHPK